MYMQIAFGGGGRVVSSAPHLPLERQEGFLKQSGMHMARQCSTNGQLLFKQKRPAMVAQFLNKIPLDDRHVAVNALLCLGLRAYERAIPAAPADVDTLRAVVALGMADKEDDGVMVHRKEVASEHAMTSMKFCNTHDSRREQQEVDHLEQQSLGRDEVVHSGSGDDGGGGSAVLPLEQAEISLLKGLAENNDTRGISACGRPLLPLICSKNKGISGVGRSRRHHTPALRFILGSVLEGTLGRRMPAHRVGMNCSFSSGGATTPLGDDRSMNHEVSDYDVSDGTSIVRGGMMFDTAMGGVSTKNTTPSLYNDDHFYPLEFVQCIMKHIESTRGARNNPVVVAASIPQHFAMYTLHSSFSNLYRSLLVSYHLSVGISKCAFKGFTC